MKGIVLADDFDTGRYDIMGFGICLPSKYITQLIANPDEKAVLDDMNYF